MEARTLRLREYGRLARVTLTTAELELLSDRRARLRVLARADGTFDLEASAVVGTLVGRGSRVVIEPKVPISRLFYLLGFAAGGPAFTGEAEVGSAHDTLAAMGHVFTEALDRALRDGPISTYEHRRDALRQPRGRIDHLDLFVRGFGVFPPVVCDFDEFTANNDANRRLLAAAGMLVRAGVAAGGSAKRLFSLCGRLVDVTEQAGGFARGASPKLDRRFDRYRAALGLADVILRHGSIEFDDGRTASVGMLVDMNVLYEDFVAEGLREALGERHDLWERQPGGVWLDEGRRLQLLPDVLWRRSKTADRLVIDVKYKSTSIAKNDDVYQLAAYCQALGIPRGALVYASAREETFVVRHGGPEIGVFAMDPDGEPAQLRERLRVLGNGLRAFAA